MPEAIGRPPCSTWPITVGTKSEDHRPEVDRRHHCPVRAKRSRCFLPSHLENTSLSASFKKLQHLSSG
jgi:hypothetical protein